MSELIKCQHCGTFVPSEKAFCPNCSEPMEPEEGPNRAHSFSSDMLATLRDDPEKYKHLLKPKAKKAEQSVPAQPPPANPVVPRVEPPVPGYNVPQAMPMQAPPFKRKSNRVPIFVGIGVVLLLALTVLLLVVFKVI